MVSSQTDSDNFLSPHYANVTKYLFKKALYTLVVYDMRNGF